jgi:hypothetical protein
MQVSTKLEITKKYLLPAQQDLHSRTCTAGKTDGKRNISLYLKGHAVKYKVSYKELVYYD